MPFCSSCGAEVKGAFCSSCGAMAATRSTAPPASASPAPLPGAIPMPEAAAVRKKTNVVVWILLGIAGLIVLGILGTVAVAYWLVRNPGEAMAKVLTTANPNIEVRNVDNAERRITIRDRRNGKEVTVSFDDIKDGRMFLCYR